MDLEILLVANFPFAISLGLPIATVEAMTPDMAIEWAETLNRLQERMKK